jgi:thiosulfate dehydrogenase [quinone] large subunit
MLGTHYPFSMAYRPKSIASSWRAQSTSTKILRAWLGVTWVYGGWDKASDPSFLSPGTVNYIGSQIAGLVNISPLGPFLNHALEHATLIGWATIFAEFVTGFATLFFIAPRFFAFVGFSTSVGLWLTVTFQVKPYFLGSDTAYAVMWLAYFFVLYNQNKRIDLNMERRGFLRLGSIFGLTSGFIGLGKLFPKAAAATSTANKKIVKLEVLPIGAHREFKASNGEPAIVFRTKAGVFAYSLVCTHQGCTVGYVGKQLKCPCHGALFDPLKGAKVTGGPAQKPLRAIKVKISGAYVVEA